MRDEPLEYRRPTLRRRARLMYRRHRTVANLVLASVLLAAAGITVYILNITAARSEADARRHDAEVARAKSDSLATAATVQLAVMHANGGEIADATRVIAQLPALDADAHTLLDFWGAELTPVDVAFDSSPFIAEAAGAIVIVDGDHRGLRLKGTRLVLATRTRDAKDLVLALESSGKTLIAVVSRDQLAVRFVVELPAIEIEAAYQGDKQRFVTIAGHTRRQKTFDEDQLGVVIDLDGGRATYLDAFRISDDCRYVAVGPGRLLDDQAAILALEDVFAASPPRPRARASMSDRHVRYAGARFEFPEGQWSRTDVEGDRDVPCRLWSIPTTGTAVPRRADELARWKRLLFSGGVPRLFRHEDRWWHLRAAPPDTDVVSRRKGEDFYADLAMETTYFDGGHSLFDFSGGTGGGEYRVARISSDGEITKEAEVDVGYATSVRISPDQKLVYLAHGDEGFAVVDPLRGTQLAPRVVPPGEVLAPDAAFTVDDRRLAVLTRDGVLWQWTIGADALVEVAGERRFIAGAVDSFALMRNGDLLLARADGRLTRLDHGGETSWSSPLPRAAKAAPEDLRHGEATGAWLELSEDERFVVAISGHVVQVFATASGAPLMPPVDVTELCATLWTEIPEDYFDIEPRKKLPYCLDRAKQLYARILPTGELRVSAGEYTYVRPAPPSLATKDALERAGIADPFAYATDLAVAAARRLTVPFDEMSPERWKQRVAADGIPAAERDPDSSSIRTARDREQTARSAETATLAPHGKPWFVQVAAEVEKSDATDLVDLLAAQEIPATVMTVLLEHRPYYRVVIGFYAGYDEAKKAMYYYAGRTGRTLEVMKTDEEP